MRQVYQRPAAAAAAEPAGAANEAAADAGDAEMGRMPEETARVERSTEVRLEVFQSLSLTETQTTSFFDSGSGSNSRRSQGGSGWASGRSSSSERAERIGAAGEVFLFGWLRQQLPGFTADD